MSSRATHGTTNTVLLDRGAGRVHKKFTTHRVSALWNTAAREAAALRVVGSTGLGPELVAAEGDAELVLGFIDAVPFPEIFERADAREQVNLARRAGEALGIIHRLRPSVHQGQDWRDLQLPAAPDCAWADVLDGTVQRLSKELARVSPDVAPVLGPLTAGFRGWCDRIPEPTYGLVHADFGGANVVVDRTGSIRVLDWEWSHLGDVAYDTARHAWLAAVGRRHRLYRDGPSRIAFLDGLASTNGTGPLRRDDVLLRVYGTIMALGHCLLARIQGRPTDALVGWLVRAAQPSTS